MGTLLVVLLIAGATIWIKRKEWFPNDPDDTEKNKLYDEERRVKIITRVKRYYKGLLNLDKYN